MFFIKVDIKVIIIISENASFVLEIVRHQRSLVVKEVKLEENVIRDVITNFCPDVNISSLILHALYNMITSLTSPNKGTMDTMINGGFRVCLAENNFPLSQHYWTSVQL